MEDGEEGEGEEVVSNPKRMSVLGDVARKRATRIDLEMK